MSAFINNFYGTYIEHIDNYVQAQNNNQHTQSVAEPNVRDVIRLPQEGDYSALVKWLEAEKKNGNDYLADADFNRSQMCRNLLKIIGWEPDQNSLRKAQSR